jgi:hypothetical protein
MSLHGYVRGRSGDRVFHWFCLLSVRAGLGPLDWIGLTLTDFRRIYSARHLS